MSTSHPPQIPLPNKILAALSRQDYPLLFSSLQPVHFSRGKMLYEIGGRIEYAFFVLSGMISLLAITEDGSTTEISMVGNEGVVGISALLGVNQAPYRVQVQIPGTGMRVKTSVLVEEFSHGGPLHDLTLRYIHSLIVQISQSAACNRFHTIEQRLCRWLLVASDRVHSDTVGLTQETLSHMLGSNRTNVTAAAASLKAAGLIEYHRGIIHILSRHNLERTACECYRVVSPLLGHFRAA
jgi:CRP-like cAMP-binding protein